MNISKFLKVMILLGLMLFAVFPVTGAQARPAECQAVTTLKPKTIVNQTGTSFGGVVRMYVKDQLNKADDPTKYVSFKTPGVIYQGYRTYTVAAPISPGAVTNIVVMVNYKGSPKTSQTWSWFLYDWVANAWVKVGDNAGAVLNTWKYFQFNVTVNPTRFVNNATRQMRLRLVSNNNTGDAKIDYEAIKLTYKSCTDPLGCVAVRPTDQIHIAYLLSMPEFESEKGARVAIDDLGGKIKNRVVKFDGVANANCDNAAALVSANRMRVDGSILAVIGTTCSGEATAVMPGLSAAGYSMISPSNTLPGLTEAGNPVNHPGYYRVSWSDLYQGRAAAQYAWSLGATTAATIVDDSGYSAGLRDAFIDEFTSLGGTISISEAITAGQTDMSVEIAAIAATSPDLVFLPVFMPEGGYVINQARAAGSGLESVYLMGSDALHNQEMVDATGANVEDFLVSAGPDASQFNAAYTATFVPDFTTRYGAAPDEWLYAPYGYDAFMMLEDAIDSVAVTLADGSLLIGRKALRDTLTATSGMAGLTGTLTCTATGDCAATPAIGVWEYQADGSAVRVWP